MAQSNAAQQPAVVAVNLEEVPAQLHGSTGGTHGGEEEDGQFEVGQPDADKEGGGTKQQLDDLQDEVDTLGAEDVADKGEGVADYEERHPRHEAAHIVACADPLAAEKEYEKGFGIEEDEGAAHQDATSEQEDKTPHIAPQGEALLHLGGNVLVENFLLKIGW